MKLYVDTGSKQVTVTKDPAEKLEQNGRQKVERGTGRPMWSTQVFVLDDDGGEVLAITTAGERPNVKVGQVVAVSKLEALPWATNGRNGVAFRAKRSRRPAVCRRSRPAEGPPVMGFTWGVCSHLTLKRQKPAERKDDRRWRTSARSSGRRSVRLLLFLLMRSGTRSR